MFKVCGMVWLGFSRSSGQTFWYERIHQDVYNAILTPQEDKMEEEEGDTKDKKDWSHTSDFL